MNKSQNILEEMWLSLHQSYFHALQFTSLSTNKNLLHYHKTNLIKVCLASVVKSSENRLLNHCSNKSSNCLQGAQHKNVCMYVCMYVCMCVFAISKKIIKIHIAI